MSDKLPRVRSHTGDRHLDDVQARISRTEQRFNDCPFIRGVLKTNVSFVAAVDKTIVHGLGKRPQGVLVLRDHGPSALCDGLGESLTQPTDINDRINLRTSSSCVVDLWIF